MKRSNRMFPLFKFLMRLKVLGVLLFTTHNAYAQFGQNLALNKPVTSSSTVGGNPALSALTDGNVTTWTGTNNTAVSPNAEWIQIDLGADYLIEHIRVSSRPGQHDRGRRFLIAGAAESQGAMGFNQPGKYFSDPSASSYNRTMYSNPSQVSSGGTPVAGMFTTLPEAAGINLGPDYTAQLFNVGVHKVRYIRIITLQDDYLDLAEVEVYGTSRVPQRNLINGNFESGGIPGGLSFIQEGNAPGWSTTEAICMKDGDSDPSQGSYIEFWNNGGANEGSYFVELNAVTSGEISQPVCVLAGETFNWSLAHKGRDGVDVMRLKINGVDVAEFTDNNVDSGIHTGVVLDPSTTTITSNVAEGWWHQYSGTWTNTTGSAITAEFAFRAVSSASGALDIGNFLDDVSVTSLSPFVYLSLTNASGVESIPSLNLPKLLISGNVPAGGASVNLNLSGTATRGFDYTTVPAGGIITVPIPAGTYDGTLSTSISLAPYIQVRQDFVTPEPNENIHIQLENALNIAIGDGRVCATLPLYAGDYTIIDVPVCFLPAINSGTALDTKYGITSLKRAGVNNGNWPMVRKGGWAALEAKTKGLVINRLTTVQKNALIPVEGMMVYDTNLDCLSIYDGTAWQCFTTLTCPN